MTYIAMFLATLGFTLRSGGAEGADEAFEYGAAINQGKKEIYHPWYGFRKNDIPKIFSRNYNKDTFLYTQEWFDLAEKLHPAWDKCSSGAKKLHARNTHQVLGLDLKTPSNFVICWSVNGTPTGGSATAINLAVSNNIKVYNLFNKIDIQELKTKLLIMKEINDDFLCENGR